eukprot:TRINITY_DN2552_c0_g1_i12.p1 TRINITY_DN2552_c0_g1~~TRINITY_DN2552_c0_g1_i12.p1  ORF type:complete len:282 (+),score=66.94 TRINITY_DN2552_c0_g1_i12:646-1491(+)
MLRQALSLRGVVHEDSPDNTRAAVVVEPRKHHLLEAAIRNTMHFLGPGWNLHVFCGQENFEYTQAVLHGWQFKLHRLEISQFNTSTHNQFVRSMDLWSRVPEEHVLIFQTDSLLFRPGMERFITDGFDFIGAPVINTKAWTPGGHGMNGGLSLRKRSSMLRCIEHVSPETVSRYRLGTNKKPSVIMDPAEDIYFVHALEILSLPTNLLAQLGIDSSARTDVTWPSMEDCKEFSVEGVYHATPVGMHGFDKNFMGLEDVQNITKNSGMSGFANQTLLFLDSL